jgi:L-rhamnose-H+ transport protein
MTTLTSGIAFIVLGGVLNGSFMLPMKFVRHWRWENTWLAFGLFGLVIVPLSLAHILLPQIFSVYAAVPIANLIIAAGLGISWGVGSLLFGMGISALGMSLGYSIIMGTSAICGTVIPALLLDTSTFFTRRGLVLVSTLLLIALALVLCTLAGRSRDRHAGESAANYQILATTTFRKGLAIAILSGVLSACFNIGFAMTAVISSTAERFGASELASSFSVLAFIMAAGFIPSFLYCLYCFRKNRSASLFKVAHNNWFYMFLMGVLWIAGVALYGAGASRIGRAGATVGWPILTSMTIFTANWIGIGSGEWKRAGNTAMLRLYPGLTLLIVAVILASMAGAR